MTKLLQIETLKKLASKIMTCSPEELDYEYVEVNFHWNAYTDIPLIFVTSLIIPYVLPDYNVRLKLNDSNRITHFGKVATQNSTQIYQPNCFVNKVISEDECVICGYMFKLKHSDMNDPFPNALNY